MNGAMLTAMSSLASIWSILVFVQAPAPIEFSSVYVAHGQVVVENYGPAVRAHVSSCGGDGWTDSSGKFSVSGRVKAGGYNQCAVQIDLPGTHGVSIPITAPAGSIDLGLITLKPNIQGVTTGTVSFLSLQAPQEAGKLKQQALKQMQKQDWKSAQKGLEKALERYADDPEAWTGLGIALQRQGDDAKAREAWEKASQLDARFVPPILQLGLAALQTKDWNRAMDLYRKALSVNPAGLPEARVYLATAMLNTGDFAAAEKEARVAAEAGTVAKAHHILGVALVKLDRKQEGLAEMRTFVRLTGSSPEAKVVEGQIRMLEEQ